MQRDQATIESGSHVNGSTHDSSNLFRRVEALANLDNVTLRLAWQSTWGSAAPKGARKRFLMLGIAWKWQVEVSGGFSRELARRVSALEAPGRVASTNGDKSMTKALAITRPLLGTRILRDWHGDRHEVHVTERGYLWRGKNYGSLSAVAKAMTEVSRNGPKFFGLSDEQRSG